MITPHLIEAVAVTAEICGRTFSEAAARVFVMDIAAYPEQAVIKALARCRKEVRGILTVQDVISRIDDGRPGPEEAWAMIPKDESQSAVWTTEMQQAFAVASPLIAEGDSIGARMAFKETYARLIAEARDACAPVSWQATLGHDKYQREAVLTKAVELGRLTSEHVAGLLPAPDVPASVAGAVAGLLSGPPTGRQLTPEELRARIKEFKEKLQRE